MSKKHSQSCRNVILMNCWWIFGGFRHVVDTFSKVFARFHYIFFIFLCWFLWRSDFYDLSHILLPIFYMCSYFILLAHLWWANFLVYVYILLYVFLTNIYNLRGGAKGRYSWRHQSFLSVTAPKCFLFVTAFDIPSRCIARQRKAALRAPSREALAPSRTRSLGSVANINLWLRYEHQPL